MLFQQDPQSDGSLCQQFIRVAAGSSGASVGPVSTWLCHTDRYRNECNNCRFWARAAEVRDDFMALELVQLAQVQLSAQLDGKKLDGNNIIVMRKHQAQQSPCTDVYELIPHQPWAWVLHCSRQCTLPSRSTFMYTIKWRLLAGVMPQEAASQADGDSQSATEELQELTNRSWAALMARGPRYVSALQQACHDGAANWLTDMCCAVSWTNM